MITYKEFKELERQYKEASNKVTITKTGDSRIGNHSYADWTTYYRAEFDGRTADYSDGGPNRRIYTYDYNKIDAMLKVGALDPSFPKEFAEMKYRLKDYFEHLLDAGVPKEAIEAYLMKAESLEDELPHFTDQTSSSEIKESYTDRKAKIAMDPEINKDGSIKLTIEEQFRFNDWGSRSGYYGRNLHLEIPFSYPEVTGKVDFEPIEQDKDSLTFFSQPDKSYFNSNRGIYRITITPDDPSIQPKTFYSQIMDYHFMNNQNNYSSIRSVSEEAFEAIKRGDYEHEEVPEEIRDEYFDEKRKNEKRERQEQKRNAYAERLHKKYEELYAKSNPNIMKVLSVENIRRCIDGLAYQHLSFAKMDQFVEHLSSLSREMKTNPKLATHAARYHSNIGAENLEEKIGLPEELRTSASYGETIFSPLISEYLQSEYERLTGHNINQELALQQVLREERTPGEWAEILQDLGMNTDDIIKVMEETCERMGIDPKEAIEEVQRTLNDQNKDIQEHSPSD